MSITASKVHIKVATDYLNTASGIVDHQAAIVGLIDLSRDELAKALREAKAQPKRKVEPAEVPGQEKLPMPPNAVGVGSDGVVQTPADAAERAPFSEAAGLPATEPSASEF